MAIDTVRNVIVRDTDDPALGDEVWQMEFEELINGCWKRMTRPLYGVNTADEAKEDASAYFGGRVGVDEIMITQ